MRATSGRFTSRSGYTLLVLLLIAGAAGATASILVPKRLTAIATDRAHREREALTRVRDGLVRAIAQNLTIPGPKSWAAAVAGITGLGQAEVEYVDPAFQGDSTAARIFLVDPGLATNLLPYAQSVTGLTGAQTNLVGAHARLMVVSTSRRGLAFPFTPESVTQDQFDALWNWAPDPVTQAPPDGWPDAWNRRGTALHITRVSLPSVFAQVSMNSLVFGIGTPASPGNTIAFSNTVPESATFWLLKGSLLRLASLDSASALRTHCLDGSVSFSYAPTPTYPTPLAFYPFRILSQTTVTNEGTLAAAWAGQCLNGAWVGAAGPRSPSYPGFSSTNRALDLSQSDGYVGTSGSLPASLPSFTLAGWFYPDSISGDPTMAFGIRDALHMGIQQDSGDYFIYGFSATGGTVRAAYNYELKTWHHIALVGDGNEIRLYVDGTPVASTAKYVSNYSYTGSVGFRLGDTKSSNRERFRGYLDEVLLLGQALTAAQLKTLAQGRITEVLNVGSGS